MSNKTSTSLPYSYTSFTNQSHFENPQLLQTMQPCSKARARLPQSGQRSKPISIFFTFASTPFSMPDIKCFLRTAAIASGIDMTSFPSENTGDAPPLPSAEILTSFSFVLFHASSVTNIPSLEASLYSVMLLHPCFQERK